MNTNLHSSPLIKIEITPAIRARSEAIVTMAAADIDVAATSRRAGLQWPKLPLHQTTSAQQRFHNFRGLKANARTIG